MDDGTVKVFDGYRVVHSSALGPGKGGIRFHPQVTLDETEALAFMMTWKCSLAGIPYGGGKGGVCCEPLELSLKEKERITRTFAARIEPFVGAWTDVPAPGINTGAQEMVWFMDTISKIRGQLEPAIFTGKPVSLWGSRAGLQPRGLVLPLVHWSFCKLLGEILRKPQPPFRVLAPLEAIRPKSCMKRGVKIVAICDITGTYYCKDGIDVEKAMAHAHSHPKRLLEGYSQAGLEKSDPNDILYLDVDVLLPCAMEGVLNKANADKVRAKYIVEGANGPLTPEADEILKSKGIPIVPDFLANSGGVIGSYFEWCQNLAGFFWTEEEYNARLVPIMKSNFQRVWEYSKEHNVEMRRAAFMVAIKRVADAVEMRGVFL